MTDPLPNQPRTVASDDTPRWPLLAVAGGAVAFVMSTLAPAAARQTVTIAGRSAADSASADAADAAASVIALVAAVTVLAGALGIARRMPAAARARSANSRAFTVLGASVWALACAAATWTELGGGQLPLPITASGAGFALSALQVLGAALLAHGTRPCIRACGARRELVRESAAACASLETAIVAAAAVVGGRIFSLTLPSLGWSALVPVVQVVAAVAALVLVVSVTWAFVGCWQLAMRR